MSSMCGGVNSSGQPTFHLRRIGPAATKPGVADVMDFHRITYMIGRNAAQCDFIIDSSTFMQSKCLSRCHARIVRQAGNQHIVYDDSLNGVFVNNMKIAGSCVLREGDRVTFGHLSGSRLPSGSRARQPDSEYQFMFEQCSCPTQGTEIQTDSDNNRVENQIHAWDKKDGAQDKTNSVKQVGPTMDAEEQTNQQPFAGEVPDMTKGKYSTGDQNRTYTDTATEQTDDVVESSNIQKQNQSSNSVKEYIIKERDVESSVLQSLEDAGESILQELSAIHGIINNNEDITDITGTSSVLGLVKLPTKDASIQTSQTFSNSESSEILKLHKMSPPNDAYILTRQSLHHAENSFEQDSTNANASLKSSTSEADTESDKKEFVNTKGNSQDNKILQNDKNETANSKETSKPTCCLNDSIKTVNPNQKESIEHSLVTAEKSESIMTNDAENDLDIDDGAIGDELHDDSSSNVDIILISESESETINISSASDEDVEHKSDADEVKIKHEIGSLKDNANLNTVYEHETTMTVNTSYEIDMNTSELANKTLECYPEDDGKLSESEETNLEPMPVANALSITNDNAIKVASPGLTCLVDYASRDENKSDNNTDKVKEIKDIETSIKVKLNKEDKNSKNELEDDSHECIMGNNKAHNQIANLSEKTDKCSHGGMSNASTGLVFSDSIHYDFDGYNDEIAQGLKLSDSVEFGDDYDDDAKENDDSETNDKEDDAVEEENECKEFENDICENIVSEKNDDKSEIVLTKQGITESNYEESSEMEMCDKDLVGKKPQKNVQIVEGECGTKDESIDDKITSLAEGINFENCSNLKLFEVAKRQKANGEISNCNPQFEKTVNAKEHVYMQQEAVSFEETKSQMTENVEKDSLNRDSDINKIVRKRKTTDEKDSSDSEQDCVKRKRSEDIVSSDNANIESNIEYTDKTNNDKEQASPLDRPKFEKIKHHFKKFLNVWSSKKKYKVTESEKETESYFYVQDLAGRFKLLELEGPVEKSKWSRDEVVNKKIYEPVEMNQETEALNVESNELELETNKETIVYDNVDKEGVDLGKNHKIKVEIEEEERDVSSQGEINYQCINKTANKEVVCQTDNQKERVDSVMENDSTVKTDIIVDQERVFKITEIKTENKESDNDPKDIEHSDLNEAVIESGLNEDKTDACSDDHEESGHDMFSDCNEPKNLVKVVPEFVPNEVKSDLQNEDLAQSDYETQTVSTDIVEASVCYTDEGMDSDDDEILNTSWVHSTPATPKMLSQAENSSQSMSPIIAEIGDDKVSTRLSPLPEKIDMETAPVERARNLKDKNDIKEKTDNGNLSCEFSDDDNDFISLEIDFTHLDDDIDDDVAYDSNENEMNSDEDNVSEDFNPKGEYQTDEIKSIESDNKKDEGMSYNEKDNIDLEEKVKNDFEKIKDSQVERDPIAKKTDDDNSGVDDSDHDNIEDTISADKIVLFDFGDEINDEMPETDEIEVINRESEDEKIDLNEDKNTGKETKLPTKRKCNFEEMSLSMKTKPMESKESSPVHFKQADGNYTGEDANATQKQVNQSFDTVTLDKTPVSIPRLKHNNRLTPVTSTPKQSYFPTPGTSSTFSPSTFSSSQLMDCTQTPDLDLVPESQMDNITEQLEIKVNQSDRSSSSKKKAKDWLAILRTKKAMKIERMQATLTSPPHSSSQGRELEMIYRRQTTARMTLEKVETRVNRCIQVINQLKNVFNREVSLINSPRVQAWRKELEDVEAKLTFPKTIIAVVGDTGAGKSSLMNAILDHRSVLPTSGMRACTAVVVEVIHNKQNNDLEADIEFLQRKEWYDELRILLKDLTGLDGKLKNIPPDQTSDAYVSYCKIRAVYGKIDTFEVLSRYNTVTHWLDRVKTIKSKRPEQFRQLVEKYIETQDPGTGGQYWPIVKHVVLKLPHCDVCSSGATLVDLPGVRDSNAARDKIAREYLKNCTAVWVVSSIHRAIDNKTAKDLLGENFRRQLLMDGQYGSIAFICTKTDVLMPSEIIRSLRLEARTRDHEASVGQMEERKSDLDLTVTQCPKEIQHLNKNVATLKGEIQELRDNLNEIGSLLDPIDVDSEQTEVHEAIREYQDELKDKEGQIETVEGQIELLLTEKNEALQKVLELDKQINIHRKAISAICARARNEYSKTEIKRDFKDGLREMKHRAGMMNTSADDDEVDDDNSDDDDDIGSTADNLQVFCCSSTEYQKMKNLLTDDGPPQVFSSVEDTQIPALRNYVHEITSIRRQQSVERLIHSLGRFVFDLQIYTADGQSVFQCSNNRMNAKDTIDAQIHQFDATLVPVIRNLSLEIEGVFDGSIRQTMEEGITNATNEAVNTCALWGAPVNNKNRHDRKTGGIACMTYRCVVRREGTYSSPTFGPIDFNEQLAAPMYRCMTVIWEKAFRAKETHQIAEAATEINSRPKDVFDFGEHYVDGIAFDPNRKVQEEEAKALAIAQKKYAIVQDTESESETSLAPHKKRKKKSRDKSDSPDRKARKKKSKKHKHERAKETHQITEAATEKNARLKDAFGLGEHYVDGIAIDPNRKVKKEGAKALAIAHKKDAIVQDSESESDTSLAPPKKRKKKSRDKSDSPDRKERKKKSKKHKHERAKETHQIVEAATEKSARLKDAFGLGEHYVDGIAIDPNRKVKKVGAKSLSIAHKKDAIVQDSDSESETSLAAPKKCKKKSRDNSDSPDRKTRKKKSMKHKHERIVQDSDSESETSLALPKTCRQKSRDKSDSPDRKETKKKSKKHKHERGMLWKILDKLKTQILQKLKEFTTSLCGQLESLGVPRDRSDRVGVQLHGSANNKLTEKVGQLKELITNRQRDISRTVTPHIQTSLRALYDKCAAECGSGMFARMKGHMTKGIDDRRLSMFDKATKILMLQLVDLRNEIIQFTQEVCKTLMQDLRAAFEPLWEAPSNLRVIRSAFLQHVNVACSEVREIYNEAGLDNTEERAHLAIVAATGVSSSAVSSTENTGWQTLEKSFQSKDDEVEKYGHLGVRVKTEKLSDT